MKSVHSILMTALYLTDHVLSWPVIHHAMLLLEDPDVLLFVSVTCQPDRPVG